MAPFQLRDIVRFRSNHKYIGEVVRTPTDEEGSLEGCLIIALVELDLEAYRQFGATGLCPSGHVFVRFTRESYGHALIPESQLDLLSRVFELGNIVQTDGNSMTGVVSDIFDIYSLEPICHPKKHNPGEFCYNFNDLTEVPDDSSTCEHCQNTHPDDRRMHTYIHDVPGSEIYNAEILSPDALVMRDNGNWLGRVDEVVNRYILLMPDDSVVALHAAVYDFAIVCLESEHGLVSIPEFDDLAKPDFVGWRRNQHDWTPAFPPAELSPGQYVIVNDRKTIRNGVFLRGQYNPKTSPEGHIIGIEPVSCRIVAHVCNPYGPNRASEVNLPITAIVSTGEQRFAKGPDFLLQEHGLRIADRDQFPANASILGGQNIGMGDRVRFRDLSAAGAKYSGLNGSSHHRLHLIPTTDTFDFDLNVFKVVLHVQTVLVTWQNGRVTQHRSTDLKRALYFELDLYPGDLVIRRDGLMQADPPESSNVGPNLRPYNEMILAEKVQNLYSNQVGVVQIVDPSEKLVRVRWFTDANVELKQNGDEKSAKSRFSQLGEASEDLSQYELLQFGALRRERSDMVMIHPTNPLPRALALMSAINGQLKIEISSIPHSAAWDFAAPRTMLRTLRWQAWKQSGHSRPSKEDCQKMLKEPAQPQYDWVGVIIGINIDGTLTVRLPFCQPVVDIKVPHDQVIAVVDLAHEDDINMSDPMDFESDLGISDASEETLSETVSYEGGDRLDNDTDDDAWASEASEAGNVEDEPSNEPGHNDDQPLLTLPQPSSSSATPTTPTLRLPAEAPDQFLVFEREPPANQYAVDFYDKQGQTAASAIGPAVLKRIIKEHKILRYSLPVGEIYVRTYESRMDLLRCVIIGPEDTPYELAPFVIDIFLGAKFPLEPPTAHFHSWTSGLGRVNPNLYEEGKICLSLLGTWGGQEQNEQWTAESTLLQLLVSVQALILTRYPYYNEAGYEGYQEQGLNKVESLQYNEKAYVIARGFVRYMISQPYEEIQDIFAWLYLPRPADNVEGMLKKVITRGRSLIQQSEIAKERKDEALVDGAGSSKDQVKSFIKPLSQGAAATLKKYLGELEDWYKVNTEF